MSECFASHVDRRRTFWATQICGQQPNQCNDACGVIGLEVICNDNHPCISGDPEGVRTVNTSNWIKGLILNILLTDGRRADTNCGWRPGSRGGHWSDSFRDQPGNSGTIIRDLKSHGSVTDAINELVAYARNDLNRLIDPYGVATAVEVEGKYIGAGNAKLDITAYGTRGDIVNVGIVGTRQKNTWMWNL